MPQQTIDIVQGFRRNLTDALVANCPGTRNREMRIARSGYLSALYCLRMLERPPAFIRSPEVQAIQDQINSAIDQLKEDTNGSSRNRS